jgi:hypothetical protein
VAHLEVEWLAGRQHVAQAALDGRDIAGRQIQRRAPDDLPGIQATDRSVQVAHPQLVVALGAALVAADMVGGGGEEVG